MSRKLEVRAWNKEKKVMCYENEDDSKRYYDGICSTDVQMINSRFSDPSTYVWMNNTGLEDHYGNDLFYDDVVDIRIGQNPFMVKTIETVEDLHELMMYRDESGASFLIIGNMHEGFEAK